MPMFRFTIRDVLWLTALVAMGVAWWADRSRQVELNGQLRRMIWTGMPGNSPPPPTR